MAKHYSGKRAAGRKPVGKRALSLLMALVMSLSLVQITAFAVEETPQPSQDQVMAGEWFQTVNGVVDANGEKANTGVTNGKGFTLSKTIEQTGENAFDITLTVETTQTVTTSDAAVQLVIDTSGSMARCAVCGKEQHGYFDSCENTTSRMYETRKAIAGAGGFLDQLLAGNKSGGKIWVSVVKFASKAYTVCDWTDISENGGLEAVKDAVNKLRADGGTNLEAGLMLARNRLSMDKVKNAASKYTVLLTDGEPTYRVTKDFPNTDKIDSDTTSDGSGSSCSEAERNEAKTMATQVKALSKLYTICYSVSGDVLYGVDKCEHCDKTQREHEKVWYPFYGSVYYCRDNSGNTYKSTAVTIGDYLRDEIATPAVTVDGKTTNYAFNANETEAVNNAFKNIATSAVEGMNGAGTFVTDPMGQFIKLSDEEKTRLGAISGVSVDVNTIKWNLDPKAAVTTDGEGGAKTYKYTLTYSITLDTAARGFESNTNYPTNGRTFLTIPAEEGAASEVDFNIPGVKGTVPTVEYTVNYFLDLGGEMGYPREAQHSKEFSVPVGTTEVQILDLYNETLGFKNVPANYVLDEAMDDWGGVRPGTHTFAPVFNLYYKQAEIEPGKVTYTVNYFLEKDYGYNKMAPDYTVNGEQETVGQITIKDLYEAGFESVPAGYELDRATLDFDGVAPGEHSFTDGQVFNLYYKLAPIPMPEYTVEYYLKDSDTDKYEVKYSETFQAEFGEVTIAALKAAWTENVPADVNLDAYVLDADMLAEGYDGIAPGTHDFKEDGQVFKLYYKLAEVEPEGPFTYWVKHIYMNGMLVDGVKDEYFENVEAGTKVVPAELNTYLDYTVNGVKHVYQVEKLDPDVETFITENDQVFTIYYQRNDPTPEYITVTVNYVEKDNISNVLRNSQSEQFELVGGVAAYDVTGLKFNSLTKGGTTYSYDSADAALTGKVESDLTITLYYKAESNTPVNPPVGPTVTYYSVTVNYYDKASGETIHTPYTDSKASGTTYDVTAQDKIAIEGYTYVETSGDALTGTLNGNKVINVYYSKTTDIDDGDTPANPGTDIGDDDVPVTPAKPPKTGDSMGLWIAAAMVSGMGLIWLSLSGKKREEEV